LHSTKWIDWKRKKGWSHSHQKNNLTQDSEGNDENGYPVPHSSKTKINDKKELSNAHKKSLKEEILQVITENFMEMILDVVNQNVQDRLKKFQDTKNKKYEKTQKQINELTGTLNKKQSKTENTINREINELKMKIETIKEEVTHDMENFKKKKSNRNTKHSGRLEQAEDRILKLKDKIEIKGKTEELLV
jgi:hypothetical protein